jgi:hypothetical protein
MSTEQNTLREYVNDLIQKNLPIKDNEKSQFGEVFTPIIMIETLYERFPKKVWNDPTYKWLDPAGGIGNFPLVLYFWLMNGLKKKIPNKLNRSKHIIEKMIYITEINDKNVNICKKIFKKICPNSKLNIQKYDFLKLNEDSLHSLNWPIKFNCIIGNPPYNIGGTGLQGSKRTHIIFTEYALNLIENKGFLSYICPPSYRETNTPMNKLFKNANGHFIFIKIYGAQQTLSLFHIQGRVDGFIYQKDIKGNTIIDDEYNIITSNLNINLDRHIPNFGFTIFQKLYSKVDKLGHVEAFRNTEMSSVKSELFTCKGKNKILHLIIEKGKRILKSSQKHSLTSTPKLLINGLGVPYVYYDSTGEYGPSQSPVIILNPSNNIVNLIKSDFFSFIAWGLRLTGNNNLPYLFDAIPNVSSESNNYSNMNNIKKGFNLTNDELLFINEHFHKYEYNDVDIIDKCTTKQKTKSALKKSSKKTKKRSIIN